MEVQRACGRPGGGLLPGAGGAHGLRGGGGNGAVSAERNHTSFTNSTQAGRQRTTVGRAAARASTRALLMLLRMLVCVAADAGNVRVLGGRRWPLPMWLRPTPIQLGMAQPSAPHSGPFRLQTQSQVLGNSIGAFQAPPCSPPTLTLPFHPRHPQP